MYFCTIRCFDSHIPIMRHKEAFYTEKKAPENEAEALQQENQKKEKENKINEGTITKIPVKSSPSIIIRKKNL